MNKDTSQRGREGRKFTVDDARHKNNVLTHGYSQVVHAGSRRFRKDLKEESELSREKVEPKPQSVDTVEYVDSERLKLFHGQLRESRVHATLEEGQKKLNAYHERKEGNAKHVLKERRAKLRSTKERVKFSLSYSRRVLNQFLIISLKR